jgi:phosphoribosylglycinamide formyltransferase-1
MCVKIKVAILISGNGSNLQAIIDATSEPDFPIEIACVISNNPQAYGLTRAKNAGIDCFILEEKSMTKFEEKLQPILEEYEVQLICLAGFMRILRAEFIEQWPERILNIHPSLLPSFPGLHAQKQALAAGVKVTGCTVHFVSSEVDRGPIILQETVPVLDGDTVETLTARILEAEHRIYPAAIKKVILG